MTEAGAQTSAIGIPSTGASDTVAEGSAGDPNTKGLKIWTPHGELNYSIFEKACLPFWRSWRFSL